LKSFGIRLGVARAEQFTHKVKTLIVEQPALVSGTITALLEAKRSLFVREKAMEKQCGMLAKDDEVCYRLMSIPGVGPVS
jgi:transposase